MKKLIIGFFASLLLCTAITGCNTVRGAGEDVEKAGEGIQDVTH